MARPQRCRRICKMPDFLDFGPLDTESSEEIKISLDEFEVLRIVDYENKTHEECAKMMDISRTTVTEIYESVRKKVAECIVEGKKFSIEGGNYRLCCGDENGICGKRCHIGICKNELKKYISIKEKENNMKIAVTYENGQIFGHFGHTETFKIYDVENNKVVASQLVPTNGSGHGALVGFLKNNNAEILICGGIGGGAQQALAEAGIKLFGGVAGGADEAVEAFLNGTLQYNPNVHCSHHDEEHGTGEHHCGEHGCGKNNHDEHGCGHHHD